MVVVLTEYWEHTEMGSHTAGMSETQGSDVPFYDAREGQEPGPLEPSAASEAPPVAQVTPPAPPTTPATSPAFSVAQLAPETPHHSQVP